MTTSTAITPSPSETAPETRPELRAVILAAGKPGAANGQAMVFQKLNGKAVIDYVLDDARAAVPPDRIYVVVGAAGAQSWDHPGKECRYITQTEPLGTGHAVLQAAAACAASRAICSSSMAIRRCSGPPPFAACSTATV